MTNKVSYHSKRSFYLRRSRQRHLFNSQWIGGAILMIFTILALVLANLPFTREHYHHFLNSDLSFGFGDFIFSKSLEFWINDTLMVVFFFVVGLEIKREILVGQLSDIKNASLPIAAAIGGMIAPAIIYAIFNRGTEFSGGWGIPMATDIAFAIGVLSILGNKVPITMKIFLTALAIVDDLGSILVIAIFYTSEINFIMLGLSLVVLAALWRFNKRNVYNMSYYFIPSILLWILFLYSGVHSTIAGVLIALTIPSSPRYSKSYFLYKSKFFIEDFRFHDKEGVEVLANEDQLHDLNASRSIAHHSISPSQRLEHSLHPFITFFIMPAFALANAGVPIHSLSEFNVFASSQTMGIFFGLIFGKPLGITLLCFVAIKLGLARMPKNTSWPMIMGVAALGGIGFTMSIFVDNLAFAGTNFIDSGKIAVLLASVCAAIIGCVALNLMGKKKKC
ncbi:MAG: Na+/H+ antiporter NhaA [Rikenellaceae bacterium]